MTKCNEDTREGMSLEKGSKLYPWSGDNSPPLMSEYTLTLCVSPSRDVIPTPR